SDSTKTRISRTRKTFVSTAAIPRTVLLRKSNSAPGFTMSRDTHSATGIPRCSRVVAAASYIISKRAAYRGMAMMNASIDRLTNSPSTSSAVPLTATVRSTASGEGSLLPRSQPSNGRFRIARKRASRKGSRIGAAARTPAITTTSDAAVRRKRAPACRSNFFNISTLESPGGAAGGTLGTARKVLAATRRCKARRGLHLGWPGLVDAPAPAPPRTRPASRRPGRREARDMPRAYEIPALRLRRSTSSRSPGFPGPAPALREQASGRAGDRRVGERRLEPRLPVPPEVVNEAVARRVELQRPHVRCRLRDQPGRELVRREALPVGRAVRRGPAAVVRDLVRRPILVPVIVLEQEAVRGARQDPRSRPVLAHTERDAELRVRAALHRHDEPVRCHPVLLVRGERGRAAEPLPAARRKLLAERIPRVERVRLAPGGILPRGRPRAAPRDRERNGSRNEQAERSAPPRRVPHPGLLGSGSRSLTPGRSRSGRVARAS